MDMKEICQRVFAELGREKQLVEFHDIVYKMLGIVVDFINADGVSLKLSKMRHFNPFCAALRGKKAGFAACAACDCNNAENAGLFRRKIIYQCYAGLTEIVIPLFDRNNSYIGCMTSGQFLSDYTTPYSAEQIHELAGLYELDKNQLYKQYQESIFLTGVQVEGLIEYLEAIGRIIIAAHNRLLFFEKIDLPDKINLVREYIEKHYNEPVSCQILAKKFYLSQGYLQHKFKAEMNVSIISYLNMYRISQAVDYLENTELSISEIAAAVGFGSISQFNRMFKKIRNISPRTFRRRHFKDE